MLFQRRAEALDVRAVHHEHPTRTRRRVRRNVRLKIFVELERQCLVRLPVRALDVEIDVIVLDDLIHVVLHPEEELLERDLPFWRQPQ